MNDKTATETRYDTAHANAGPPIVHRGDVLFTLGLEIQEAGNELVKLAAFRQKVDTFTAKEIRAFSGNPGRGSIARTAAASDLRALLDLPPLEHNASPDCSDPGDEQAAPVDPLVQPADPGSPFDEIRRMPVVGDRVIVRIQRFKDQQEDVPATVEAVNDAGRIDAAYLVGNVAHRRYGLPPSAWKFLG